MFTNRKIVYTGANIVTLSDKVPHAEAVSVRNGRIEAVGSRAELVGNFRDCDVIELEGVIHPGFIDSHSHLSSYAACIDQVYCGLPTIADVLAALRQGAGSDEWILGYAYDDTGIGDCRHLTRHDLDTVSRERPVLVAHISVHLAYANTEALRRLGIGPDTRIPGGDIPQGADGQPLGVLFENAAFAAFAKLPPLDPARRTANLAKAIADYNRQGFTSIIDGGVGFGTDPEGIVAAYTGMARNKTLDARVYLQMTEQVMNRFAPFGLWDFGGDFLRLGGLKYFTDGSIQGFTAALADDYFTRPGFRGELVFPEADIRRMIIDHHCMGMQVAVHTNGDHATEVVLRAFEDAIARSPRMDLHHMIVHAQLATDAQLARMKACGIIPTLFSRHIEVWGDRHAAVFLGPERTARMDPAGSCVRLGMPFSLHVDSPVLPVTALGSMHAAVNRISSAGVLFGPEQRISPLDALRAYTVHAALCCGGEHDRGRIEPGRLADFTVLSENLEQAEPAAIRDIKVLTTIVGGRIVHRA